MKSKCVGFGLAALIILPLISGLGYSQEPGAPPPVAASGVPITLSPAAADVVKLAESGTTDDVLLAYIQKTPSAYNLSPDDIVYLKDVGLSSPVITSMLNHDKGVPTQTYTYNQQPYPVTAQPPAPPEPPQEQTAPPPPVDTSSAPAYVSDAPAEVNYFYNDLSPYGSWVMLQGYGWCWQPRTVAINRSWRPYCDGGHWVYSDAGWFWASDYSWGWGPFHYGRWHQHPTSGWVWFPDTVWAPAWVVWRSSGDHCGWAPLPYRSTFEVGVGFRFNGVGVRGDFDFGLRANAFTFVATRDFNDRDLGHRRLPPVEVTKIYNQTTIINNYTVNNNHVIVNHGIPVERVAAATHTQIRTVAIHDLPPGASRPTTKGGNSSVVYHHELKAPTRSASPIVAQKIDDRHPVIQHQTVAPTKLDNRPATRATQSPSYNNSSRTQTQREVQTPNQSPQTGGEKFTPRTQTQTAQPVHQSTPTANTQHVEEPKSAYRAPETTTHSTTTTHSSTGNTAQRPTAPLQAAPATTQNSQTYYPKSYHQAATAHALPPEPVNNATHSSTPSGGQPTQSPNGQNQNQNQNQNRQR